MASNLFEFEPHKKIKNKASSSNNDNDFLQKIKDEEEKNKEKQDNVKFKGYYLDKDVADKIDSLRGRKYSGSYIVNYILREYLEENGYL